MQKPRRYLVINADDFGRSKNVNRAILYCYKNGVITDTNLMVNMPGTKDAITAIKKNPKLPVGIHAVFSSDIGLTNAKPLTNCESIVKNHGYFPSPDPIETFWNQDVPMWSIKEVEKELASQHKTFVKLVGKLPTHVTSQHHVHAHPHLLPVFIKYAKKYAIPLRIPIVKATMPSKKIMGQIPTQILMTDEFVTDYKGNFHRATYKNFIDSIQKHGYGSIELMVHPAFDSNTEPEYLRKWWARELKMLTSKSFKRYIKRNDVCLINYSTLHLIKKPKYE